MNRHIYTLAISLSTLTLCGPAFAKGLLNDRVISSVTNHASKNFTVNGFEITQDGNTLISKKRNTDGSVQIISSTTPPKGHRLFDLYQLSSDELILGYETPGHNYPPKPTVWSVQIISLDASGQFIPVQNIESKETHVFLKRVLDENTFVAEIRHYKELNSSDNLVLYKRDSKTGHFEIKATPIKNAMAVVIGKSAVIPGTFLAKTFTQPGDHREKLYRIDSETGKSTLLLKGLNQNEVPENTKQWSPQVISQVLPDVFSLGFSGRDRSDDVRELEIFATKSDGSLKSIGTILPKKRDNNSFSGHLKSLADDTFSIVYDHSFVTGEAMFSPHLRTLTRDLDIVIVTVKNGKMSQQWLSNQASFQLDDPKADGLTLFSLNNSEFILYGKNSVQIVRRAGSKYKLAESLSLEKDATLAPSSTTIGFEVLSDTSFVLKNRTTENESGIKSTWKIIKTNGRYKLTK
ncbi:MAG: hypothetical protein A2622_04680 [Bdellovibrionales bacterium RIFCSPHIGHO2_01_FULL_40_29]|nr:MAG: hypothetical protein A2622_04680 [Bdellovibrionales bacterium RIFCSPHIGHO2_01_FULL_40_29]OFZ34771.1 MAG: hypothetical protein A3D17_10690 [Bdellovibrionales bacterium RIFCSPHIGHO2_02_FULL_40_15]